MDLAALSVARQCECTHRRQHVSGGGGGGTSNRVGGVCICEWDGSWRGAGASSVLSIRIAIVRMDNCRARNAPRRGKPRSQGPHICAPVPRARGEKVSGRGG